MNAEPTTKYAADVVGLQFQLGQALIALALIEAETRGPMRQSELLRIVETQRGNINTAADAAPF